MRHRNERMGRRGHSWRLGKGLLQREQHWEDVKWGLERYCRVFLRFLRFVACNRGWMEAEEPVWRLAVGVGCP